MLEKIREGSKGIVAQVILGLVILTFAVSGVSSYFGNTGDQAVAVVNGEEISQAKFEQSYQNERARMEQQFGEMFATLAADPSYMNNFRNSVLDRLINETLLKQQADKLGMKVSDAFLIEAITKMPEFQLDGVFNNDRYLALLRQNGFSANQFRDLLREQFVRNQLMVGVAGSEFALPSEMKDLIALQQQNRDIEYSIFRAADFVAKVESTDEKLQAFYQDNIQRYATPEQVSLQFVELKGENLAQAIAITDEEVEAEYNSQLSRYQTEERRRVSHILLESAEEDEAVAKKAAELLEQLQQGADFAALAKEHSADTVSAENGGDLDFITRDVMEAEFENAAYALTQVGELSPVVKTSFGYHLIKLTEIEAGQTKPLADVKASIITALQQEKAANQFADLQQKLTEVSFEVADNLDEAATSVGAQVQEIPLFSKETAAAPFDNAKLLDLVFSADFIKSGINSDVVEIAPQHVVVVRLIEHVAAKTKTFDEVKTEVSAQFVAKESSVLAKAKAESLLEQFKQGQDIRAVLTAESISLTAASATPRFGGELDAQIRTKAFELPRPIGEQKVTAGLAELVTGDVAVVLVSKVTDVPVETEPSSTELEQYAQQLAQTHFMAVQKALLEQSKVERRLPAMSSQEL